MALPITTSLSLPSLQGHSNPIYLCSPSVFSCRFYSRSLRVCALKTESDGSDLLRRPVVPSAKDVEENEENREEVDWEDQILEDTVPLVGFVRTILHSGKYENGDRLSAEHQQTIVDRLLPYHPEYDKKIGCGIDYITVDHHPDFESSRCLFIVRRDGEMVDFSYWKCIKGMIRKNYPLYADSFILRHFRRRRRNG
ncbi:hypothetical protein K2173_026931 [Erythroxylum novogranatense]|uniref:DCL protein n=1 Tax=Erythroxylum novogranatense TaxID=1862640 RepID=A0AAV8U0D7_9ROSI|nr:hypothetical protein K2173_026931 [Erythroxylum novogranatense]